MAHAGEYRVAVVEDGIARRDRTCRTITALERDDTDIVVALQLGDAYSTSVHPREIEGKAQYLELAKRIEVRSMA